MVVGFLVQSVVFTAVPFFVVAAVWFVIFGLSLSFICLCYCCCPREPYGYSRLAYALSLIFLILFTLAAMFVLFLSAIYCIMFGSYGFFRLSKSLCLVMLESDVFFYTLLRGSFMGAPQAHLNMW